MSNIPEGWTLIPRPTPFSPDILVPTKFLNHVTEISRYRDCIVCDKSFKKPHEGEYRCESCRAKVLEDERRDRAGKQLLDANARVKP